MNTGFLTETEMMYLTDLKQSAAQIRWLRKFGIRHTVSALGRPRVTWEAVNGAEKPRTVPNFSAVGLAARRGIAAT